MFLKIIQTDVFTSLVRNTFLTEIFSLFLFLISWKDELYGSPLRILFFVEHVYLKFKRFYSQKRHSFEKFQLNLADRLKMSLLKRKYSIYQSVFFAHFSEKKFSALSKLANDDHYSQFQMRLRF